MSILYLSKIPTLLHPFACRIIRGKNRQKPDFTRHTLDFCLYLDTLCVRVCVCACVCMFWWVWWLVWSPSLLRLSVVRQTDWQKNGDGLRQAKQQVCLLNMACRHMNAPFTFSSADSCFHQQKKRLVLLAADCLSSARDRQPLSLGFYVYCLSPLMLLFLPLVMTGPELYLVYRYWLITALNPTALYHDFSSAFWRSIFNLSVWIKIFHQRSPFHFLTFHCTN